MTKIITLNDEALADDIREADRLTAEAKAAKMKARHALLPSRQDAAAAVVLSAAAIALADGARQTELLTPMADRQRLYVDSGQAADDVVAHLP